MQFANRKVKWRAAMGPRLKFAMYGVGVLCVAALGWGFYSKTEQANEQKRAFARKSQVLQPAGSNREDVRKETRVAFSEVGATPSGVRQVAQVAPQPIFTASNPLGTTCNLGVSQTLTYTGTNPPTPFNCYGAGGVGSVGTYQSQSPSTLGYIPPSVAQMASIGQSQVPTVDPVEKAREEYETKVEQMRSDAQLHPDVGSLKTAGAAPRAAAPTSGLQGLQEQLNDLGRAGRELLQQQGNGGAQARAFGAPEYDPNGDGNKARFDEKRINSGVSPSLRTLPLSRWVLEPPDKIPATLTSRTISDLPGDIVAIVSKDVLDSPTHSEVLIPAGSLLVGSYNSLIAYAQNRVQENWSYLRFPDGSYIQLPKFRAQDTQGSTGLKDVTDNHIKRLIGGVMLGSLFAAAIEVSQNHSASQSTLQYPTTGQVIGSAVGQQVGQVGQQITSRNLDRKPTLIIRPGEPFDVFVDEQMVFEGPYSKHDWSARP